MEKILNYLKNNNENRKLLNFMGYIFFWIMINHGFILLNHLLSHDSLNEFDASVFGNIWKIQLGRVLVPFYRMITRGDLTASWTIGILSVIYFAISLYLLVKIFRLENKFIIFLIAGVLVGNISIISLLATYINDMDCNIFALLMSIAAVYYWNKKRWGISIIFLSVSLGIYQSYICVTITVIIMKLMIEILEGEKANNIIKKGVYSIIIFIFSGVLYAFIMKSIHFYQNISVHSGGYNSINKFYDMSIQDYLIQIYYAYLNSIFILMDSLKLYSKNISRMLHILLFFYLISVIYFLLANKKVKIKEKLLFIFLGILLPLGMNITHVLAKMSHNLMHYAIWLTYFFILVLIEKKIDSKWKCTRYCSLISIGAIIIILWSNFITANDIYIKKSLEKDATILLLNRVINDLEKIEGYNYNQTKVLFLGNMRHLYKTSINYRRYEEITGVWHNNISGVEYYKALLDYIFHYPIIWANGDEKRKILESKELKNMGSYPRNKSIRKIDGIIVVKFN